MDLDYLFESSNDAFDVENVSPYSDPEVPLCHLRACEFGKDGIPAGRYTESEGEIARLSRSSFLMHHVPPEYAAGLSEDRQGMACLENTSTYVLISSQMAISRLYSRTMKVMNYFND